MNVPIRRLVRRLRRALTPKLAPLADNPYTTHMPVLAAVARLLPVQRVLEFGCGEYSTLTFLNREVFPNLERLDSYENKQSWAELVRQRSGDDSRLTLTTVAGSMSSVVDGIDSSAYDLVFLDDSTNLADRSQATMEAVAVNAHLRNVLIIHDFEHQAYRAAAYPFGRSFRFTALNPNTGVVWRDAELRRADLKSVNRSIKVRRKSCRPDDVAAWSKVFASR